MLYMSYVLKKNGAPLYRRNGVHWWLTGFKPGEFSEPTELVMDVEIDFHRVPTMRDPFVAELRRIGYANVLVQGSLVSFTFDRPKGHQPAAGSLFVSETQKKNRLLVDTYNRAKSETGVPDNSPTSVERILVKSPDLIKSLIRHRP
jgi:hypothetical protein